MLARQSTGVSMVGSAKPEDGQATAARRVVLLMTYFPLTLCLEPECKAIRLDRASVRKLLGEVMADNERLKTRMLENEVTVDKLRADNNERHTALSDALARVKGLEECMRMAGLLAFMSGRPPREIAAHLQDVMQSYVDATKNAEARVAQLEAELPVQNSRLAVRDAKLPG